MRVVLEDGGAERRTIALYNPQTGQAMVLPLAAPFKKLRKKVLEKRTKTVVKKPVYKAEYDQFGVRIGSPAWYEMQKKTPALSGPFKGLKKKLKAKKAFKEKKQNIRQENKLKRVEGRQTSKTGRQEERHLRKDTRLKKRTATQEGKLLKKVGQQDVVAARQASKIRKADQSNVAPVPEEEQEYANAAIDTEYDEESDALPEGTYDVNGGDYMMSPEDQGGDDSTIDVGYDEVPQEEQLSAGGELDLKKVGDFITMVTKGKVNIKPVTNVANDLLLIKRDVQLIRQAVVPGEDLSAGWIDAVFKVAKGAAGGIVNAVAPDSKVGNALLKVKDSKTGQAVTKLVNSKAGQAVQTAVANQRELVQLRAEASDLRAQNASLKKQRYYFAAGGAITGYIGTKLIRSR